MMLLARLPLVCKNCRFANRQLAALVCLFITGCGQGAYEAKLNSKVEELQHEAKFNDLRLDPIQIPVPGATHEIKLRLPNAFFGNTGMFFTPEAVDPLTGQGVIPPKMLQPPFMTMPGMKLVYQAAAQDPEGLRLPYFCYIASIERGQSFAEPSPPSDEQKPADENKPAEEKLPEEPKAEGEKPAADKPAADKSAEDKPAAEKPAEGQEKPAGEGLPKEPGENEAGEKPAAKPKPVPLEEQLLAELNKAFGKKEPLKWETVRCDTPKKGGEPILWRRVVVEADQEFAYINADIRYQKPGKFELYAFPVKQGEKEGTDTLDTDAPFIILIGWRAPDAIERVTPIDDWALRAAGTLTGF